MASLEIIHVTKSGARSAACIDLTPKHGVYYGVRDLPGGGYRVHVATFVKGRIVELNENRTPWAFKSIALARSLEFANEAAGRYVPALPVVREG
jgi:hypothetical protein